MSASASSSSPDANATARPAAESVPPRSDAPAPILAFDGRRLAAGAVKISKHNFRDPSLLGSAELRLVTTLSEKFAAQLSARLSTFLRMECAVKLKECKSAAYAQFIESIGLPAHIVLFQAEPLRGIGVLAFGLNLGLAMADRILGGKGRVTEPVRNLTEIENALLEDAVHVILGEWAQLWSEAGPAGSAKLAPQVIGHDSSPRFLQTSEPGTVLMTMTADVSLGENSGAIQIGVPFSMIEGIVKKMSASPLRSGSAGSSGSSSEPSKPRNAAWRAAYNCIAVPVVADWQVSEVSLAEILKLQPGDVIPLSQELIPQTRVRVSDTPQFVGTVGVENGRIAIQLTSKTELN